MARALNKTTQIGGPLNTANIDSVTRDDHDHRILWQTTNVQLKSHGDDISSLKAMIADLQAKVAKLSK